MQDKSLRAVIQIRHLAGRDGFTSRSNCQLIATKIEDQMFQIRKTLHLIPYNFHTGHQINCFTCGSQNYAI